jgi:hypothetical protein
LVDCLALLAQKSSDLALVVERWETLPRSVRQVIATLAKGVDE